MNAPDNQYGPGSSSPAPAGSSSSKAVPTSRMTELAADFTPGQDDVICGRGKKCYNHIGNTRFRHRVVRLLDDYARAKSKLDKSAVLGRVMADVRRASPMGGFVKQDESGQWFEVGDFLAREKTSQAFRDALHERYKSSNVSKKKRRQREIVKAANEAKRIAQSEQDMSARLERLSSDLMQSGMNVDMGGSSIPQRGPSPSLDMMTRFSGLSGRQLPDRSRSLMDPRFPDPLFGRSAAPNASPGSIVPQSQTLYESSAMSTVALPPRAHSFSHSQRMRAPRTTEEALHSSLPNMHFSEAGRIEAMDALMMGSAALNQSLPNLHHGRLDFDPSLNRVIVDPNISSVPLARSERQFVEPLPFDLGSSETTSKRASKGNLKKGDEDLKRDIADKELLACLSKLTEHSITDDNPFEPIPLPVDNPVKKPTPMDVSSGTSNFLTFDQDPEEASEREFAEG